MSIPVLGTIDWKWLLVGVGFAMFILPWVMGKLRGFA